MAEQALDLPRAPEPQSGTRYEGPAARSPLRGALRRHVWWWVAVAIVAFSTALVLWARTRPSYDAYGWLVWGYQTLHGHLDLGGAPSWKPLPYVFTVPFALFGPHLEMRLWMVAAVALSFAGSVFAGRIAFRVVAAEPGADAAGTGAHAGAPQPVPLAQGRLVRLAPWAAAVVAGAAVLAIQDYMHYVLSVQSDPVIVTLVLAGIDSYLCGRRALAFWLGVLAGLGRPEAWILLGPYTLYLWFRAPRLRWQLVTGWALTAFMWFGVPTITNDRPFVSAQLAMNSPRMLRGNQIVGALHRFWDLYNAPLWVAAGLTAAWGAYRRHRVVLGLSVAVALWVIVEIAFALHGWPAIARYMFEAAAIAGVLGGIGVGWLLRVPLPALGLRPGAAADGTARLAPAGRVARYAGPLLAAAIVISLVPYARIRYEQEHDDLTAQRVRTNEINALLTTFDRIGGVRNIRRCGQPVIDVEWASLLAFTMRMDVGFVGYRPGWEIHHARGPIVVFNPIPYGWQSRPFRTAHTPTCRRLRAKLVFTRSHPGGRLIRQ